MANYTTIKATRYQICRNGNWRTEIALEFRNYQPYDGVPDEWTFTLDEIDQHTPSIKFWNETGAADIIEVYKKRVGIDEDTEIKLDDVDLGLLNEVVTDLFNNCDAFTEALQILITDWYNSYDPNDYDPDDYNPDK